ncbi:MAG: hypothetical protein NVSMB1_04520 [Polyangiales bacterium]
MRTHRPAVANPAPPSFTYARRYAPDTIGWYRLTLDYQTLGGPSYSQTTISRHHESDRGERVTFESLARITDGLHEDWSAVARAFPGYEVSIAQGCVQCLALPNLTALDPHLTEPVTDIHTFLVAVSPQAGVDQVHSLGERHRSGKPVLGNWSHGAAIPVGEDCIVIEIVLDRFTPTTATLVTSFTPPPAPCLTPARSFMSKPVAGRPNNFQQIEVKPDGRDAMWGKEQFVVTTTVRTSDGVILDAHMDNELTLVMRMGCSDDALEQCRAEVPVRLRRQLTFQRLLDLDN